MFYFIMVVFYFSYEDNDENKLLKSCIFLIDKQSHIYVGVEHFPRMTTLFSELPVDALDFLLESLIYFS